MFISEGQQDRQQLAQSSIVIINNFFDDLHKIIIDLCVTCKSKCLFTKSLKNEVISCFLSNTKKFCKNEDFWKDFVSFAFFNGEPNPENPTIVEKIQLLELSAIAGFYCTFKSRYTISTSKFVWWKHPSGNPPWKKWTHNPT